MPQFGPGSKFTVRETYGPWLIPSTSYLDVREKTAEWWASLWPQVHIPQGHAWAQITAWADSEGLPYLSTDLAHGRGRKLACTDPDTQRAVIAFCEDRIARGHAAGGYVSVAASDGGGWDDDPGNGEHTRFTPSDRMAILAAVVAEAIAPVRPVIQAYGFTVPPPVVLHHPSTVVVVYKSYAAAHMTGTLADQIEGHRAAGAVDVRPAVGWTDWYTGLPGTSLVLKWPELIEVLRLPRYGAVDTIHGAASGSWAALVPYWHALAAVLHLDEPQESHLSAALDAYCARVYGVAGPFVRAWLDCQRVRGLGTGPMWAALQGAYGMANLPNEQDIRDRLCYLVHHTRWIDLMIEGEPQAMRAWAWSCPYSLDLRMIAGAVFREPQGNPPDGLGLWAETYDAGFCEALTHVCANGGPNA